MTLRVTRQFGEVLGTGDGKARVARQYIEVLAPAFGGTVFDESGSSTLSALDHEASAYVSPIVVSASSTIVLSQDNEVSNKNVDATSAIGLSQLASVDHVEIPYTLVTLSLGQVASATLVPVKSSVSTLSLGQVASVAIVKNRVAESVIELAHAGDFIGPKWVYANTAIPIVHEAYVAQTLEVSASSTLSLSHSADSGGTRRVEADTTIVLDQFADTIVKIRAATTTIVLSQAASVDLIKSVTSQINLTHEARLDYVPVLAASQLFLTQDARFEPLPQFAESQIVLSQSNWKNIRTVSATSHIALVQTITVQKPIRANAASELSEKDWVYDEETGEVNWEDIGLRHSAEVITLGTQSTETILSFNQTIGLTHVRANGTSVSATSTLSLSQAATISKTGEAANIINLGHSAKGWAGVPGDSQLELTQSASVVVAQSYGGSNTLELSQAATYLLITSSTKYQYSPFVGESTDPNAPAPPPITLQSPLAGIQVPFQLVYPATGAVTDAVSLKAPNLGNLDRLAFNRINRETRGGTLIVFADPIWPKIQTMVLTFSGLLRVEAQSLLTFIDDHLGQEIGIIDWEHRYWKGVITAPDGPMVEDRFDSHTASFEFQGEMDPAWSPQVIPPDLRYSATRTPQEGGYYVPVEPTLPVTPEALSHSAEADSTIKIGYPIYMKATGHLDPAQADAAGPTQVIGLSISDANVGFACTYITEGTVERTDWTEVAGSATLVPGNTYFLSPTTAGQITNVAPSTLGQYVVRVGRAITTTKLDVEIELPILL